MSDIIVGVLLRQIRLTFLFQHKVIINFLLLFKVIHVLIVVVLHSRLNWKPHVMFVARELRGCQICSFHLSIIVSVKKISFLGILGQNLVVDGALGVVQVVSLINVFIEHFVL